MKRGTENRAVAIMTPPIRNVETRRNTRYDGRQVPTRPEGELLSLSLFALIPLITHTKDTRDQLGTGSKDILRIRRPGDLGDDVMCDAICIQSGSTRPCEEVPRLPLQRVTAAKLHGDMECTRTANLNDETIRNCGQDEICAWAGGDETARL